MNKELVSKVADILVEMGSLINDMYIAGVEIYEPQFDNSIVVFTYPRSYENSQENPKEKCTNAVKTYKNFTIFANGLIEMLEGLEDVQSECIDTEIQDFKDFCYKCFSDGILGIRYNAIERDEVWDTIDVNRAKEKAERDITKFKEGIELLLGRIPSEYEEVQNNEDM